MAKDPAFLFYPGDWLGGTLGMSFEEKGAYLDLLIFQFNKGRFTEKQALMVLKSTELWDVLKTKFVFENDAYINLKLQEEQNKRKNYTESRRQSRLKCDEDMVRVYIVRDNVRITYKIGSSVNPIKRYNELSNQVNPAIMEDDRENRDITLVWYSDIVPRTEEKVIHKLFVHKNIVGEWFKLTSSDLNIIFKKYKGTYHERTLIHTNDLTENANEELILNNNNLHNKVKIGDKNEKIKPGNFGLSGAELLAERIKLAESKANRNGKEDS